MNVMKMAHEATRKAMAKVDRSLPHAIDYKTAFSVYLRAAHRINRESQMQKIIKVNAIAKTLANDYFDATGYAIVGTVVDSEGNLVHVGESSGSEMRLENDARYYMNSKNGFSKQDLILKLYGVHGVIESFKIVL